MQTPVFSGPARLALSALLALGALASSAWAATAEPATFEPILLAAQQKSAPDAKVGPAVCRSTELKQGVTNVPCTVMVEGLKVPYHFVVTVSGTKANYKLQIDQPLLDLSRILDVERPKLKAADRAGLTISCGGGRYVLAKVGQTLNCTLKTAGRSSAITVKVNNTEGAVSIDGKLP